MSHIPPRIGISLDWMPEGDFSSEPYYCLRQQYVNAVYAAGGIPVLLPSLESAVDDYLHMLDGIVIPGGDFAFPKEWYADPADQSPFEPSPRLTFDITLIHQALERELPLLAICAGMQILACLHGCRLTSTLQSTIDHHNTDRRHLVHSVNITPHTLLHDILGRDTLSSNSAHREAVIISSSDVLVNALAEDGTIEGIELPYHPFALGVQWHPEFFIASENPHRMLFNAFVAQAMDF